MKLVVSPDIFVCVYVFIYLNGTYEVFNLIYINM